MRDCTSKPLVGARLIPGHPLAPKHAWLCNEMCGLGVNNVGSSTGYAMVSGAGFLGSRFYQSLATTDALDAGDSSLLLPLSACTIALRYQKTDATLRASSAFGVPTGVSGSIADAYVPWSDGTVYWDWGGASAGTSRLSVAGLTFGDDIWVFTVGVRGMEIWQNGNRRASQTGSATRTHAATSFRVAGPGANGVSGDIAKTYWLYIFDRQLTENECRGITATPFAGFASRSNIVDFAAAVPVGGSSVPNMMHSYRLRRAA